MLCSFNIMENSSYLSIELTLQVFFMMLYLQFSHIDDILAMTLTFIMKYQDG